MYTCYILLLLCVSTVTCIRDSNFQVLEKLQAGMRMAKNFLSFDHAAKVAKLVSDALEKSTPKAEGKDKSSNNIFSGFLRLFGFDAKKLGAIAVNALIVVAQLISSSVSLRPPSQLIESRNYQNETPFEWMIRNKAVSELLVDAKNESLPNMVMDYVKERSLDEDTGCLQLLICKSSPFIHKMQEAIIDITTTKNYKGFNNYLPNLEGFAEYGDDCEKKHPFCMIFL